MLLLLIILVIVKLKAVTGKEGVREGDRERCCLRC
jgi:hypothetical protein